MVEAPGPEGGLYRSDDSGATWAIVNNSQRLRARPFYFHYVDVNPKNENEVWVNELGLWKSTDGGKTFAGVAHAARRQSRHLVQPGQSRLRHPVQRRRRERHARRRAELVVDPQPADRPSSTWWPSTSSSRTGSTGRSRTTARWSCRACRRCRGASTPRSRSWGQASGCETGQIWPRPDGSVVWGACKGEVGRYVVATGQEQHYWVYPQNRYGHNPEGHQVPLPAPDGGLRLAARSARPSTRRRTCCTARPTRASRGRSSAPTSRRTSPTNRSRRARRSRATSRARRSTAASTRWPSRASRRA